MTTQNQNPQNQSQLVEQALQNYSSCHQSNIQQLKWIREQTTSSRAQQLLDRAFEQSTKAFANVQKAVTESEIELRRVQQNEQQRGQYPQPQQQYQPQYQGQQNQNFKPVPQGQMQNS